MTLIQFICSECNKALLDGEEPFNYLSLKLLYESQASCEHHIHDVHKNGKAVKLIKFYRAQGEYGFLSNLFVNGIVFEDKYFRNAEEAYQYGKPKDKNVAEWLVSAPKPHLTAMAAHGLLVYDVKENWQEIKVDRMRAVLAEKFKNPIYKKLLLATDDALLIEGSNTDAFWGIGKKGNGKNMLGTLLMELRSLRPPGCRGSGCPVLQYGEEAYPAFRS